MFTTTANALAQFDRAKWRLIILLPCWLLQLALTLSMLAIFSWRLSDTLNTYEDQHKKGRVPSIEIVWEVTNIVFSLLASLCVFVEIAKYLVEALTPWTMLFTHIIKLTTSIAIVILDAIIYVQRDDRHYSIVGLAVDSLFVVIALALAIYAALVYRRLSKYNEYSHPVNVKGFGYNDGLDQDTSYMGTYVPALDKRLSAASSRLSISSSSVRTTPGQTTGQVEMENMDNRASVSSRLSVYTHERDTQFEEYRARRSSVGNGQDEPMTRRESISSSGTVVTRSRGNTMPRVPSYTSEHGLVAVPEEEDAEAAGRGKHDQDQRDREALLDPNSRDSISLHEPPVAQEVDLTDEAHLRY